MNLHEYQSKQLFAQYGLPVPRGSAVASAEEAVQAAAALGGTRWVVKAQVHAGGRGKGGGVKVLDNVQAVREFSARLLGSRLVTPQTGPAGLPVNQLLVEETLDVAQELYLAVLVDRARRRVVLMASAAGGMNIEEVAATQPEKIHRVWLDPAAGFQAFQGRQLAFALGLRDKQVNAFTAMAAALCHLFQERDASLVEVNPLAVLGNGALVAMDAKVNLDGSALFRQKALEAQRDASQEDERERIAREHDLNYISLDGDIACMVNGAGLAMATMDIIQLHGGSPANFLDVGGGATAERVAEAFRIILSNPQVKAILVNIFGGIVRCDLIAEGILKAIAAVQVKVPVVVRLEGTNAGQGRQMLAASPFSVIAASDLTDAATKAVAAARGGAA
jgi:succinyl-CoA synthetase beta subunit